METAAYERRLERLVDLSVDHGHDAYADVAWDEPGWELRPDDPRLRVPEWDVLAALPVYRDASSDERSRLSLHRIAGIMRVGWEFENILQQGLLAHLLRRPNGTPEFRYIHHEVMEESQHSLMFNEFVVRSGTNAAGMPAWLRGFGALTVMPLGKRFPELFYVFVLGGEVPVDVMQRRMLRDGIAHPLVERILAIHVEEETRHVSFAASYLRRRVPELGRLRRGILSLLTPIVFGVMARLMVAPTPSFLHREGIPASDLRAAMRRRETRDLLDEIGRRPRRMMVELGLMNRAARRLWIVFGLGDPRADRRRGRARPTASGAADDLASRAA